MKSDLYVTGKPAADRLLRDDGTALLIGMLLDQQVPMEWAFAGPFTITPEYASETVRRFFDTSGPYATMQMAAKVEAGQPWNG